MPALKPQPLTRLPAKIRTWWGLPMRERIWLPAIWLLLGVARASVLILPFRVVASHLGDDDRDRITAHDPETRQVEQTRRLGHLIQITARHTPWDANCLAQALVAHWLLRLHYTPHAVYLGVRRTPDGGLAAHAWVDAGPVRVTGGRGVERFTVVKVFTDPPATWSR